MESPAATVRDLLPEKHASKHVFSVSHVSMLCSLVSDTVRLIGAHLGSRDSRQTRRGRGACVCGRYGHSVYARRREQACWKHAKGEWAAHEGRSKDHVQAIGVLACTEWHPFRQAETQFDNTVKEQRMKRLHFLLEKSSAYATILGRKLAKQQEEARGRANKAASAAAAASTGNTTDAPKTRAKSRKRKANDADYQLGDYLNEEVSLPGAKTFQWADLFDTLKN